MQYVRRQTNTHRCHETHTDTKNETISITTVGYYFTMQEHKLYRSEHQTIGSEEPSSFTIKSISWSLWARVRSRFGRHEDLKTFFVHLCWESRPVKLCVTWQPNGQRSYSVYSRVIITSEVVSFVKSSETSSGWRRTKFDSSVGDEVQRQMLAACGIKFRENKHTRFYSSIMTHFCMRRLWFDKCKQHWRLDP